MYEQEHVIRSVEMAREMAYAEDPFRELARRAIQQGQFDLYENLLQDADDASVAAGRRLIEQQTHDLNYFDRTVEMEKNASCLMTKDDLKDYEIQSYPSKNPGFLSGKIWTAFCISYRRDTTLSLRYPNQYTVVNPESGGRVRQILLTRALLEESKKFNNMGRVANQFLENYFNARTSVELKIVPDEG
jgi:hypothetical protein